MIITCILNITFTVFEVEYISNCSMKSFTVVIIGSVSMRRFQRAPSIYDSLKKKEK